MNVRCSYSLYLPSTLNYIINYTIALFHTYASNSQFTLYSHTYTDSSGIINVGMKPTYSKKIFRTADFLLRSEKGTHRKSDSCYFESF